MPYFVQGSVEAPTVTHVAQPQGSPVSWPVFYVKIASPIFVRGGFTLSKLPTSVRTYASGKIAPTSGQILPRN